MTPSTVPTSKVLYFPSAEISNFLNFWIPSHLLSSKTLCSVRWKRVKTCFSIAEAPRDSINGALLTRQPVSQATTFIHHLMLPKMFKQKFRFFIQQPSTACGSHHIHRHDSVSPPTFPKMLHSLNLSTPCAKIKTLQEDKAWKKFGCVCFQGTECSLNCAANREFSQHQRAGH